MGALPLRAFGSLFGGLFGGGLSQSRRSGFLGGGFAGSGGGLAVGLQALNALHTQGQAGVYQINAHADDDHDYQYGQGVFEHILTV